jgi:hypothetical protein
MKKLPGTGVELPPLTTSKTAISEKRGAKSGALDSDFFQKDPDLTKVIRAWPGLSTEQRKRILEIVKRA